LKGSPCTASNSSFVSNVQAKPFPEDPAVAEGADEGGEAGLAVTTGFGFEQLATKPTKAIRIRVERTGIAMA